MTREQKIAKAHQLHDEGQTLKEIGDQLGVHLTTVWRYLHPERARATNLARNKAKQAWANEHDRSDCPNCGQKMGVGARRSGYRLCVECRHSEERARTADRGHQIERWWAEGLTLAEIAARLGWSRGHIAQEFDRLRRRGFDLPYRHRFQKPKYDLPMQRAA